MNLPVPASQQVQAPSTPSRAAQGTSWPHRVVNVLVALAVIAVAGAAFVLSYDGVHAVALEAGVSAQLARVYPGLFDAVLVIACVAAVVLRDAPWWARCWAWLVLILVLAAIGVTDVAHAMSYSPPHRQLEGMIAAAPVVAVLLAFSLLLTLLRFSRTQPTTATQPALTRPVALPAATAEPGAAADATLALTAAQDTQDAPAQGAEAETVASADAGSPAGASAETATEEVPAQQAYWDADVREQFAGQVYPVLVAEPDDEEEDGPREPEPAAIDDEDKPPFATAPFATVPRLHRARVTPTPPSDDDSDDEG